ncbi:MAG: response regulator [Planctomycetaceae bacterium]|jgi:signal transduction histidine kinase/AmiR/NasT family two-component response regulator|nr:response regulator [Planctomycetaceae bacterium]
MKTYKNLELGTKPKTYYSLWGALLGWTILVAVLAVLFADQALRDYLAEAKSQARAAFERDLSYRAWCSFHGGVYVPVTEDTPPNPLLVHPERDVVTTEGKKLTLISPAAMTNRVHTKGDSSGILLSHLVSDKPLNETNKCDEWEDWAYQRLFDGGVKEVSEVLTIDNDPHIRLMRPLMVTKDCMECHEQHGYKLGNMRGAICITMSVRDILTRKYAIIRTVVIGYGAIWFVGTLGIILAWRQVLHHNLIREKTIITLQKSEANLKKAKIQAEDANKTKTQFLANMSHEIRTPMSAILGFSDMLYNEILTEKERNHYVGIVRNNANLLLNMINDLLDMTKIESGKIQMEIIPVSPCRICEDVVTLMRGRATEKSLALETLYHFPMPDTILTDQARLRQILINLTGNAVKFTQQGKITIEVAYRQEGNTSYMDYTVHDTGIGITQEQIARIFKPFIQADSSINRSFGGTGLGLVISQKFSELLGGGIAVSSTYGVGSKFKLTIPVTVPQETQWLQSFETPQSDDTARVKIHYPKITGKRVLLAEDGVDNQRLFRILLEKMELDVSIATTGQMALDMALQSHEEGKPFHLILMDMQMPVMDGCTATEILRSKGWNKPIVALTANAMTNDRNRCLAAGADRYLSKPIVLGDFVECIAKTLLDENDALKRNLTTSLSC